MAFRLFECAAHAKSYAKFRPTYPDSIAEKIVEVLSRSSSRKEWEGLDVACGSGQSTDVLLRAKFAKVYALDISAEQIRQAQASFEKLKSGHSVEFLVASAENIPLPSASLDLVAVGQGLHWFDLDKFYAEVDRLLIPGGSFAAFGYGNCELHNPALNPIIKELYDGTLDGHWSPQRRHVENLYHSLAMPDDNVDRFEVSISSEITVDDFIGYLSSWSAYQSYMRHHPGSKVLQDVKQRIMAANKSKQLEISFPFFLLISSKLSR